MSNYRVLQLTNNKIGAIAVTNLLPLGTITRRVNRNICADTSTFSISTTGTDTITVNEAGNYDITYSLTAVASAAGVLIATLRINDNNIYSVSQTVDVGETVNLILPYQTRVLPNYCGNPNNMPINIQIQLNGVGITSGTSNIIVERVY